MKSPLRYPGGKSKKAKTLVDLFPDNITALVDPFVGGGSVPLEFFSRYPDVPILLNDLHPGVSAFWASVVDELPDLVREVDRIFRRKTENGRDLYRRVEAMEGGRLTQAIRFFILNRCSFSGLAECGGYSEAAYRDRFTDSSIHRLAHLLGFRADVMPWNMPFQDVLGYTGYAFISKGAFIFVDPPYFGNKASKLYGPDHRGANHTGMDHEALAATLRRSPHRWLLTYDDHPKVRELYRGFRIQEMPYTYSMASGGKTQPGTKAQKATELVIMNY